MVYVIHTSISTLQDLSRKVDLKTVNLVNYGKEKDINKLQDDICGLIAQSAQVYSHIHIYIFTFSDY